jgi:hypothetical protein
MIHQTIQNALPRAFQSRRPVVISRPSQRGFDEKDPLNSIREYRMRKVASKRIPSRIS